jgi:hypothetical protein
VSPVSSSHWMMSISSVLTKSQRPIAGLAFRGRREA